MPSLDILLTTAVGIGFLHTLIGVDHALPFVAIGRARGWSLRRVLGLTFLCGLGHVLSSVLLGVFGIGLGVALDRLEWIESTRGSLAAWLLIGFGLAYAAWAWVRRRRGRTHSHPHVHADGTIHTHPHGHEGEHAHPHQASAAPVVAWSLFILFVLGPCEPLIPLLMVPALAHGAAATALVAGAFAVTTIGTMLAMVTVGFLGLRLVPMRALERHADVAAGLAVAASGLAIQVLGV